MIRIANNPNNKDILEGWFRVDVRETIHPNMLFMVENLVIDHGKLIDVVGANVI